MLNNRIAYGCAALNWGGKSVRCAPEHSPTAGDLPKCEETGFENYIQLTTTTLEAKARAPTSFYHWKRIAENGVQIFAAAYGEQHRAERERCFQDLRAAHQKDPHAFPAGCVLDL